MATAVLEVGSFVEVEPEMKIQAENILNKIGLSYSEAVKLFTQQIILRRALPIELKLEGNPPVPCIDDMTEEEFDGLIQEAFDDIEEGRWYTSAEMRERTKNYGVNF